MNHKLLKAGALVAAGGALTGCGNKQEAPRPNVVFILADDLGWGDLGCYGQQLIDTPNIDALALTGIRFTQCYSGTAVSAPSRSCLLTGTHSGHTAIRGNLPAKGRPGIPEGQQELPGCACGRAAIQDLVHRLPGRLRDGSLIRRHDDRERQRSQESVQERILVSVGQGVIRIIPPGCQDKLVQGLQVDVHVAVLEHLVVEIVLGEIGVEGQQGAVFFGGIGKFRLPGRIL